MMLKSLKKLPIITSENSKDLLIRQRNLHNLCQQFNVDYFVTSSKTHLRYLTGYNGSNGLLILNRNKIMFVTDSRYQDIIKDEVVADKKIIGTGNLLDFILKQNIIKNNSIIGYDPNSLQLVSYSLLENKFSSRKLKKLPNIIDKIMSVKSESEINKIKEAVKITDTVFNNILKLISPSITEKDISAEITYQQQKLGAEGDAFPPIIAFGERSALPHSHPTKRKISKGAVLLDFGCRVDGYNSDMTRTLHFGKANSSFKKHYQILLQAQEITLNSIKPGISGKKLDSIARNFLRKNKLDKYFIHSVGHGLSLDIHAFPRVSKTSTDILEVGNVITIEPGIYFPGKYGIRIEDDAIVGSTTNILNKSPKNLIEI